MVRNKSCTWLKQNVKNRKYWFKSKHSTKWATCPCLAGDPRQEVRGPSLAPPPKTALKRRKIPWKQLTSETLAQTFVQRRLGGIRRNSVSGDWSRPHGWKCVVQNSTLEMPLFHIIMWRVCRTHTKVLLCAKGCKMPFNLPYMLIGLGIFGFIKCTVAWFYLLCFLKWDS